MLFEDITIDYYHAVSYALIFFLDCFLVIILFCFFSCTSPTASLSLGLSVTLFSGRQ